jgi:hypothetical protein
MRVHELFMWSVGIVYKTLVAKLRLKGPLRRSETPCENAIKMDLTE